MKYAFIILLILLIIITIYVFLLHHEIKHINYLLEKRLSKGTNQLVNINLFDKNLDTLSANINKCLKAEENLRLKVINEENDFKEMIANISHDLRTPLTAIKGYLQLIDTSNFDSKQGEMLDIAKKHVVELESLIQHFYEYAYLVDSDNEINVTHFSLSNLTAECLAGFVPELESKNFELDYTESNIWIDSDKELTLRVIHNLLRNCLAHSTGSIHVWFETDNHFTLHVSNSVEKNISIDTSRIFDRFYVADSSRHSTGLGLSIVKLLMEKMNGEVGAALKDDTLDIWISWPNKI